MQLQKLVKNVVNQAGTVNDGRKSLDLKVMASMLGPAYRGLILQKAKGSSSTEIPTEFNTYFNWDYHRDQSDLSKLYDAAKKSQWNAATDLDWSITVDPHHPTQQLMLEDRLPLCELPQYRKLEKKEQELQKRSFVSWMMSQFLHGEQGALFAACQVTQSVRWMDGKLYGSTQVMDEGRHIEVFHRYLTEKIEKLYQINDNLYVVIDALMSDSRWDMKFLGMQILVEGLALGGFGTLRDSSREPLLRELLKYVIIDEGRHVHYGVVALKRYYTTELSERSLRERENWAYEFAVLMRNRFLGHEFYDEYYGHLMSRKQWNQFMLESQYMKIFREKTFRRLIPNLKKVGLLSGRIRPHYEALGLLQFEGDKASNEMTSAELLGEGS